MKTLNDWRLVSTRISFALFSRKGFILASWTCVRCTRARESARKVAALNLTLQSTFSASAY
eukprot:scaffold23990_cov47-Cyclotella_meneghiniana.AAC.1